MVVLYPGTHPMITELQQTNILLASGKINSKYQTIIRNNPGIQERIITSTSFMPHETKMNFRILCIRDGIKNIPKCRCGEYVSPILSGKRPNGALFRKFCSVQCAGRLTTENVKQTKLDLYGDAGYNNHNKTLITLQKKYGVENISQIPGSRDKAASTFKSKTGLSHYTHATTPDELQDYDWLYNEHITKQHNVTTIAHTIGTYAPTVVRWLKNHKIEYTPTASDNTLPENVIRDILEESNVEFTQNDTTILGRQHLDFLIAEKNLAIEVNGIYWHTESRNRGKQYHLNKTKKCKERNIQLLHFWDSEILNHTDLVKSMILAKMGISERVYARKCSIGIIDSKVANDFVDAHHLQGHVNASIRLGLVYDGTVVCIMTIGQARYTDATWEILRFCTKQGVTVTGGFSKLLKEFERTHSGSIVSYANRRISDGNTYDRNGFTLLHASPPTPFYTNDHATLISRIRFQKHKLAGILDTFDPTKTEYGNMHDNGYERVWDCGNLVYIKNN